MRRRSYISPSAVEIFYDDLDRFYMQYLCETILPRDPQTQPMSIGSAFDAYAKSFLHEAIYGQHGDDRFSLQNLFESQVEAHNRDWAWKHGKYVFDCYKKSGALADLLTDLEGALEPPSFEIEVRGEVKSKHYPESGMILLGKPDVYFMNKHGHRVILDWKVNGYCAKSAKSPSQGYIRVRHCDGATPHDKHHKEAQPILYRGMNCSLSYTLDKTDPKWATQLATYGWLLGEEVGTGFLTAIDQVVAKPSGGEYPILRIAEHRTIVDPTYQHEQFKRFQHCWNVINSDWIFRDMTKQESQLKCLALDDKANYMLEHVPDEVDAMIKFHQPAWKF